MKLNHVAKAQRKNIGFDSIDDAYEGLISSLISVASRHLINPDQANDVAHDVFVKVLEHRHKHKKKKVRVSSFIMFRELLRACRRANKKYNLEIPFDFNSEKARKVIEREARQIDSKFTEC